VAKQSFQTLFCQKFRCPEAAYEARAFRKCLYWQGKLFAPVIRKLRPQFFDADLQFIRYLGAATGLREANAELADFHEVNRAKSNFWRKALRIRVSGRKAGALAQRLFSAQGGRSTSRGEHAASRRDPPRVVPISPSEARAETEKRNEPNIAPRRLAASLGR
jgi:hypothetical protein